MSVQYKLSIVTISYNDLENLERTINSVLSQSFKDYEYIVVDGGSNDGSKELLVRYNGKIGKWVSEKDKGIYDAMNKGLAMASGEYVIFLNSGDVFYTRDTLNKVSFGKYPQADIFYGETMIVDKEGRELGLRAKSLPHNLTWKHFRFGMRVCHQSVIVRRSIADRYDLRYKHSADYKWVLQALIESKQNVFTNSIIASFLIGGDSVQNHRDSLKERFMIMRQYYGLTITIINHIAFIISALLVKLGIIRFYRKNYLE